MRLLERNKTPFYYALFEGLSEPPTDEYGNITGSGYPVYGNPIAARANISAAKGETQIQQFGDSLQYDKVLVMETAPFDEFSVLWIDKPPVLKEDGTTDTPWDYIVIRRAESLNVVSYAVRKVNVS